MAAFVLRLVHVLHELEISPHRLPPASRSCSASGPSDTIRPLPEKNVSIWLRAQQAAGGRVVDQLGDGVHAELAVDVHAVGLDGLDADAQLVGDFLAGKAAHQKVED